MLPAAEVQTQPEATPWDSVELELALEIWQYSQIS